METSPPVPFAFRRWVRRSCRKALVGGLGVAAVLVLVVWWLQGGHGWAWGRAFAVLLGYSLVFWLSLAKIWWTAGKPAALIDHEALYYQGLHAFRPRRIPFRSILACGPRPGTRSLRLVLAGRGSARELFLNLGVIENRHRFAALLGERLQGAGLEAVAGTRHSWARREWREAEAGALATP